MEAVIPQVGLLAEEAVAALHRKKTSLIYGTLAKQLMFASPKLLSEREINAAIDVCSIAVVISR